MNITYLGQVYPPESQTSKGMYILNRGNGREVITTCYKEGFIEDYLARGIIKAYPVPDNLTNAMLPYYPKVWMI